MLRLVVLGPDRTELASCPLGTEPVHVGRRATNQLVLGHRSVSGRHAAFWLQAGEVWVEDLGSRNGTFRANGSRVRQSVRVPAGEPIRLGHDAWVEVRGDGPHQGADHRVPLVCLVDGEASFPIHGTRFTIGPDPLADVHVAGPDEVTLTVHPDGELWLGRLDSERSLPYGEPFEVSGQRFVVRGSPADVSATWDVERERYPYALFATLDAGTGASATLTELGSGRDHTVSAENRAVFLFLLGRQLVADRSDGQPVTHEGWMPDPALATGIWGKAGASRNLNVLVTRVRGEVKTAGFNPWFIEKRRGHTRLQLQDIKVA